METSGVTEWKMFDEFLVFLVLMVGCWAVTTVWDKLSGDTQRGPFQSFRGPAKNNAWLHRTFVWGMIIGFCGCTAILFLWAAN